MSERTLNVVILLGLMLAVPGIILTSNLIHIVELQSTALGWAKLAKNSGNLILITALTFQGTYEICKNRISLSGLAKLGLGMSLFMVYIFILSTVIKSTQDALNPEKYIPKISIEDIQNSKITPEKKEFISKRIAKDRFYFEGKSTFLNASGEIVEYIPSSIEVYDAAVRKEQLNQLIEEIDRLKFYLKLYIAILIFSLLFAYLLARHERNDSKL